MQAYQIGSRFGIDQLELSDRETPTPGPGEVLLRMKAASLNFRDLWIVEGERDVPLPLIPLSDGVGEVVEVGAHVSDVKAGDRVAPIFAQNWIAGAHPQVDQLLTLGGPLDGVLTQYGVWPAANVVKLPAYLSHEEAACLPCAAVSAWNALFVSAQIKPGDTVLIQGTGGVSLFGLKFAKLAGAEVVLLSSSDEKLDRAKALGADHLINYRSTPQWGKEVRRTLGRGVDCVLEIGGAGTLEQSLEAVRNGGQISFVGVVAGKTKDLYIEPVGYKSVRLQGIRVGNRQSFESMLRAMALHRVHPIIDKVFRFDEAADALRYLKQGGHFGKICIDIGA